MFDQKVRVADLTVAISTQNRPEALALCLDALLKSEVLPAEIVVVDQSKEEETCRIVNERKRNGAAILYYHQDGKGLGASQNMAICLASASIVAVTDDDCVPMPDWVAKIEQVLAPERPIDGVTGRVLPVESKEPGLFAVSSRTSPLRRDFDQRAMPWEVGSGNNFAVRRSLLVKVGGNDERLGPGSPGLGGVDMDLFYRLLRAGARIRYEPDLIVKHARTTLAGRLNRRFPYGYGMGACCSLWLLGGDWNAVRIFFRWWLMRGRRFTSGFFHRNWLLAYEELLVLFGTLRGLSYGIRVKNESN